VSHVERHCGSNMLKELLSEPKSAVLCSLKFLDPIIDGPIQLNEGFLLF
jgi:hypothetical protein